MRDSASIGLFAGLDDEDSSSECSSSRWSLLDDMDMLLTASGGDDGDDEEHDHLDEEAKTNDRSATPGNPSSPENPDRDPTPGETRRRKNRESMAKLRHERRQRIQQLETQAKFIHKRLGHVLQWMMRHRSNHDAVSCRCVSYADLVAEAESLLQEQYALEEDLHQRQKYRRFVTLETKKREEDHDNSYAVTQVANNNGPMTMPTGYWFQFLDSESPFFYESESLESSTESIQGGLHLIQQVHQAFSDQDAPTHVLSAHCLGWQTERSVTKTHPEDRPLLRFQFSRTVSRLQTTLAELQNKTWDILSSSDRTARMYGSSVHVKVIQRLSDDTFVSLRSSPVRTNHQRFRHFLLVARMQSVAKDSAMVLLVVLDKQPRQEELEEQHVQGVQVGEDDAAMDASYCETVEWLKHGGSCLRFSHVDDHTIQIEYTGALQCVDDDHANYLMIEKCAALLRWEHLVVPPRLLAL